MTRRSDERRRLEDLRGPCVGKGIADGRSFLNVGVNPGTLLRGVGHRASSSDRDLGPGLVGRDARANQEACNNRGGAANGGLAVDTDSSASGEVLFELDEKLHEGGGFERNAEDRNRKIDEDDLRALRGALLVLQTELIGFIFWKHRGDDIDSLLSKGVHLVLKFVFASGPGNDCDLLVDPIGISDHEFMTFQ